MYCWFVNSVGVAAYRYNICLLFCYVVFMFVWFGVVSCLLFVECLVVMVMLLLFWLLDLCF